MPTSPTRQTDVKDPSASVSTWRANAALIVVSAGAFCYITSETLPSGLLTLISSGFGTSVATTGQLITAYAAVVVIFSIPLTLLTKRFRRRWLLTVTLTVFGAGTVFAASAATFEMLMAARIITGLSHALFWSIAAAAVTGLFPPEIRGRMVARLAIGQALGPVLGVPVGTWLGQQTDWRVPFMALGCISLVLGLATFALFPSHPPEQGGAAEGTNPDRGRFYSLLLSTCFTVTAGMGFLTYIAPYLLDHVGFADRSLSPVLAVSGVAGVLGTIVVGRFLDQRPWQSHITILIVLLIAQTGLWALWATPILVLAAVALHGAAFSALAGTLMHRGIQLAPGNTDIAVSSVSTAFNVGIASGAFLGGQVTAVSTVGNVPLMASVLTVLAIGVVLLEARHPTPDGANPLHGSP